MVEAGCEATGSDTKIYPFYQYWIFGVHSVWMGMLLSLDIVGRTSVLSCNKRSGLFGGGGEWWLGKGVGNVRKKNKIILKNCLPHKRVRILEFLPFSEKVLKVQYCENLVKSIKLYAYIHMRERETVKHFSQTRKVVFFS